MSLLYTDAHRLEYIGSAAGLVMGATSDFFELFYPSLLQTCHAVSKQKRKRLLLKKSNILTCSARNDGWP